MQLANQNKSRVIAALPGIRTTGVWASKLAPLAAMRGAVPILLNYGWFQALWMMIPPVRDARVRWLRDQYDRMREATGVARPSIIAHSFGTWLLGELLRRYDDVVFDRIVITGSVLPENYDWASLLESGRVLAVHNEVATADMWPTIADWVSRIIRPHVFGQAGVRGFKQTHPHLTQSVQNIDHSDMFYQGRLEAWLNWLTQPTIPAEDLPNVSTALSLTHERLCEETGLNIDDTRIAVLMPTPDRTLVIPHPHLAWGLTEAEYDLQIPFGQFAAGRAFSNNHPVVEINPVQRILPEAPKLSFVCAVPIRNPSDGRVIGVLGIDSAKDGLTIADISNLKLRATIASREWASVYVSKSNGV